MKTDLTDAELERYSRQILVHLVGFDGQLEILRSTLDVWGSRPARVLAVAYLRAAGATVFEHQDPVEPCLEVGNGKRSWTCDRIPKTVGDLLVSVGQLCTRILLDVSSGAGGADSAPPASEPTPGNH